MNWDIEVGLFNPFQTYDSFSIEFQWDVFYTQTFLPIDAKLK